MMKRTYTDRHFEIATPATTSASATPATTSATTLADTSADAQATSTGDALGTVTQARGQRMQTRI